MLKKILFIITKSDIGGAQKYVNDLASNLDKSQFEAKILYGGRDLKWLSNKTRPWFLFLNDWLAVFELIKIYRREKPDIIHLNSSKAGVIGSLAAVILNKMHRSNKSDKTDKTDKSDKAGAKVIFTAHGWVFNPTNALSFPARWFYIFLHKFAALFQDKIICVSEYDYQLALQYAIAPEKKLTTIHNGINLDIKFLSKETARKEITKKLSTFDFRLSTTYPWIGSIGRLVKEKNYETLIAAAALIPNAYFFIIGEGYELKNLQLTTYNLQLQKRILFVEPAGDDAKYLKAFDIFVMSSIKEGLPYILLEAMAAKLPIVVTEAGGIPEIIRNNENGLMVSQKNPDLLAKTINGLLANKNIAEEIAGAARDRVAKKFSLPMMIENTEKVYCSLIISS